MGCTVVVALQAIDAEMAGVINEDIALAEDMPDSVKSSHEKFKKHGDYLPFNCRSAHTWLPQLGPGRKDTAEGCRQCDRR